MFTGRAVGGGDPLADGVVTEVGGVAFRTGEHLFVVEPGDSLGAGFLL